MSDHNNNLNEKRLTRSAISKNPELSNLLFKSLDLHKRKKSKSSLTPSNIENSEENSNQKEQPPIFTFRDNSFQQPSTSSSNYENIQNFHGIDDNQVEKEIQNLRITLKQNYNDTIDILQSPVPPFPTTERIMASVIKPMDVVNQLMTFDGNNADEFIEDLRNAAEMIREVDEALFVKSVLWKKIKTKNLSINKEDCTKIDQIIKAIRAYCPEVEGVFGLFGKLATAIQSPNENVQQFADRLQDLMHKIIELKKEEEGMTMQLLKDFTETMRQQAAGYFKKGVKKKIRYELPHMPDFNQI